jgi:hypothetical protein
MGLAITRVWLGTRLFEFNYSLIVIAMERKSTFAARGGSKNGGRKGNGGRARKGGGKRRARAEQKFGFEDPLQRAAPVSQSKIVRTQRPKMTTLRNGDAVIVHREYIDEIIGGAGSPSAFNGQIFDINPGQASTFPWLSKIAANYESYSFKKLKFDYETEAASSLGGSLVMAVDYDATDAPPLTKQQAMAYRGSVRSAPWAACQHSSMLQDLSKLKTNFIRPGAQPAGTDLKTYDIGKLFVISQGVGASAATLGELYVEYEVWLLTPVYDGIGSSVVVGGSAFSDLGNGDDANPFGPNDDVTDPQSVAVRVDNASIIYYDQPGEYIVTIDVKGTGLGFPILTAGPGVVATTLNFIINTALTNVIGYFDVRVNQAGSTALTMSAATTVTECAALIGGAPVGSLNFF